MYTINNYKEEFFIEKDIAKHILHFDIEVSIIILNLRKLNSKYV